jgi:signal transduction histidine kinase
MFEFRHYPISKKLTAMNVAVSGSALVLACLSFVVIDVVNFRQNLSRYASAQAEVIATNTLSALMFHDPASAQRTISALSRSPNVTAAVVYDGDGAPFASYFREPSERARPLYDVAQVGSDSQWVNGELSLLRPMRSEGKLAGFVSIRVAPLTLNDRIVRYLSIVGIVLALSLVAALLVSSGFQKAVAKPIRNLAEIARSVSNRNQYSLRAVDPGGEDEVAILIRAFNHMLTQIEERDSALQEAHEKLEARVRRRTAELERAKKDLKKLSGRLLTLQDEERRNIARELHDSTAQVLAALSLNLAAVEAERGVLSENAGRAMDESIDLAQEISSELRTLTHLLHPPLLDVAGLASALRWYVLGFAERSGIRAELELSEEVGRLPRDVETAIFRIVQESLTNVHRHSESEWARVAVTRSGVDIRVEIRDRGKGIPSKGASPGAPLGIGIQGMTERAAQLGGELEIVSSENGTSVVATLPCPPLPSSDSADAGNTGAAAEVSSTSASDGSVRN